MSKLPLCSTKNTCLDGDMTKAFEADQLVKIVVFMVPDGKVMTQEGKEERCYGYVAAHFSDEPVRPMYLATRRVRKMPKLFIDSKKMLEHIYRDFPGIPVQTVLPALGIKATDWPKELQ